MSAKQSIDKAALAAAVKKISKLRVEDVGGRKERPAETVQSCLNRGYNGLGSEEGVSYIFRHAIGYYLAALNHLPNPSPSDEEVTAMVREAEVLLENCQIVEDIDTQAQHEATMVIVRKLASMAHQSSKRGQP